jgi:hypothetical protein
MKWLRKFYPDQIVFQDRSVSSPGAVDKDCDHTSGEICEDISQFKVSIGSEELVAFIADPENSSCRNRQASSLYIQILGPSKPVEQGGQQPEEEEVGDLIEKRDRYKESTLEAGTGGRVGDDGR